MTNALFYAPNPAANAAGTADMYLSRMPNVSPLQQQPYLGTYPMMAANQMYQPFYQPFYPTHRTSVSASGDTNIPSKRCLPVGFSDSKHVERENTSEVSLVKRRELTKKLTSSGPRVFHFLFETTFINILLIRARSKPGNIARSSLSSSPTRDRPFSLRERVIPAIDANSFADRVRGHCSCTRRTRESKIVKPTNRHGVVFVCACTR